MLQIDNGPFGTPIWYAESNDSNQILEIFIDIVVFSPTSNIKKTNKIDG